MIKIRICPKCGSNNVNVKITASAVFGAPQQWQCLDCGFEGYLFPEIFLKNEEKN